MIAAAIDKLTRRYELDDKIQYWSDYLATRFHPRTFSIIHQYEHHANAFNSFSQGVELWKSELFCEEWVNNCRVYAEECDYLQVRTEFLVFMLENKINRNFIVDLAKFYLKKLWSILAACTKYFFPVEIFLETGISCACLKLGELNTVLFFLFF